MKKKLALIIEDDPAQQTVFQRAVEMADFNVEVIGHGDEALKRLQEVIPDLVILDLHLPTVSGDKILAAIRADERLATVPVILATADPLLAETLAETSDLVLLKPISFNQLRDLAVRFH